MIEFFVPIQVIAKQADRSSIVIDYIHHYQPTKVAKNAVILRKFCEQYAPSDPMCGPLVVELVFQTTWRSNEPKKNRRWSMPKDTKPDLDNLIKQMLDVLEKARFYLNDSQVYDLHARKLWTDDPGVQVILRECEDVRDE